MSKERICYYYDGVCLLSYSPQSCYIQNVRLTPAEYFVPGDTGNYYYGECHPMKPHRIRMAHSLLVNYGLYKKMQVYVRPLRPSPPSLEFCLVFTQEAGTARVDRYCRAARASLHDPDAPPPSADALSPRSLRDDNFPC